MLYILKKYFILKKEKSRENGRNLIMGYLQRRHFEK